MSYSQDANRKGAEGIPSMSTAVLDMLKSDCSIYLTTNNLQPLGAKDNAVGYATILSDGAHPSSLIGLVV